MVMEGPPAPHCVGREFVRQYYTLLNQAPAHLHRFYNNNSSFVHGGLDSPSRPETKVVVGQKQIHQKIQQLNFRDCHAKISQVDSQATLGDGVVVQVTGELSNSGQPMRRFTQTFVLAAQTPKKFYVHNDIFRYQDMLFSEEDSDLGDDATRSETEDDIDVGSPNADHVIPTSMPPQHYYNNLSGGAVNNTTAPPAHLATPSLAGPPGIVNGSAHPEEVAQLPQMSQALPATTQATPVMPVAPTPQQPAATPAPAPIPVAPEPIEAVPEPEPIAEVRVEPAAAEEQKPVEPVRQTVHHVEPVSNEPKTYATLVKSGGPISFASAAGGASPLVSAVKPVEFSPPGNARDGPALGRGGPRPPRGGNGSVRGVGRDRDVTLRPTAPPRQSFSESDNGREPATAAPISAAPLSSATTTTATSINNGGIPPAGSGESLERRRGPGGQGSGTIYTDSQQLFLGNLPHHATEDDLKEVFRKYGSIVDLRIHSKPNAKGMVGNRVPNYGFVTFESANCVQEVLSNRPIYFPDDGPAGQKLNVEEKKTRPRHSLDGRPPSDGRPPLSDNGPQRDSRPPIMGPQRGGGGIRGSMGRGGPRGGFPRGGLGGAPIRGGTGNGFNNRR